MKECCYRHSFLCDGQSHLECYTLKINGWSTIRSINHSRSPSVRILIELTETNPGHVREVVLGGDADGLREL